MSLPRSRRVRLYLLLMALFLSGVLAALAMESSDGSAPSGNLGKQFSEGLKNQHMRVLESRGESITIMVVGESGLGKTSLLSSLFRNELLWPDQVDGEPTIRIAEQTVTFDLEGLPFSAKLIDTPGYGDVDVVKEFSVVLSRIHSGFRRVLSQERRIRRADKQQGEAALDRVDVILYFFAPHRCKRADVALLKLLRGKASIVPILAKADSMTAEELATFRVQVRAPQLLKPLLATTRAPLVAPVSRL